MADDILISPKHVASRDQTKIWADTRPKTTVYDVVQGNLQYHTNRMERIKTVVINTVFFKCDTQLFPRLICCLSPHTVWSNFAMFFNNFMSN